VQRDDHPQRPPPRFGRAAHAALFAAGSLLLALGGTWAIFALGRHDGEPLFSLRPLPILIYLGFSLVYALAAYGMRRWREGPHAAGIRGRTLNETALVALSAAPIVAFVVVVGSFIAECLPAGCP
jgi:hypothetical protein